MDSNVSKYPVLMENVSTESEFLFCKLADLRLNRIWEVPIFSSTVSYGRSNLASQCGVRALVPYACFAQALGLWADTLKATLIF